MFVLTSNIVIECINQNKGVSKKSTSVSFRRSWNFEDHIFEKYISLFASLILRNTLHCEKIIFVQFVLKLSILHAAKLKILTHFTS